MGLGLNKISWSLKLSEQNNYRKEWNKGNFMSFNMSDNIISVSKFETNIDVIAVIILVKHKALQM